MGLVVLEGVAMVVLAVSGLRELIFKAIPLELKKAIAIGIGLFIAFIGLYNSGIVAVDPASGTPVELGSFTTWPIFVAIFGILFTFAMRAIRFKGDLIVGIIGTTVVATIINASVAHHRVFGTSVGDVAGLAPPLPGAGLLRCSGRSACTPSRARSSASSRRSSGSSRSSSATSSTSRERRSASARPAGYVDKDGNIPQFKKALIVDGLAAVAGGAASASSATTYIESGSGVAAGGRTGWVAVVAGLLFFPFMFISPLIGMVPTQATAAALIVVGWLMISTLTEMEGEAEGEGASKLAGIDFHDLAIGLSAALTIM